MYIRNSQFLENIVTLFLKVCVRFLRLFENQNTLHLPVFSILFSMTFLEYRGTRSKKYFTDHRAGKTIQLSITII